MSFSAITESLECIRNEETFYKLVRWLEENCRYDYENDGYLWDDEKGEHWVRIKEI